MGLTVQLTDTQLAQFTATGIIVVDGEPCKPGCENCNDGDCWLEPESWRKLTDPCPTCDERGSVEADEWDMTDPNNHLGWVPCPDCAGGRQVVTFKATCPRWEPHDHTLHCRNCDATGVVTLGRFTIRLLPVVDGNDSARLATGRVVVSTSIATLIDNGMIVGRLALDPLPRPGQWAVKFEAVS